MKKIKIFAAVLAVLCVGFSVVSCTDATTDPTKAPSTTAPVTSSQTGAPSTNPVSDANATITLNGADTTVKGEGVEFKDGTVSITKGGVYTFSGTLNGGQIYVNVEKPAEVELVLNGVTITSQTTSAIYVASAEKVKINVIEGTTNTLKDSSSYQFADGSDEPNACIFSADDMTIKGKGKLIVTGNYKNGISSKNDIKIKDVDLTVNAYNTGIRGKDSVEIESGNITVDAGNDGIKSSNDKEVGRGYILVTGGTLNITADDDAFQAETDITVKTCSVTVSANGKEFNCAGTLNVDQSCVK